MSDDRESRCPRDTASPSARRAGGTFTELVDAVERGDFDRAGAAREALRRLGYLVAPAVWHGRRAEARRPVIAPREAWALRRLLVGGSIPDGCGPGAEFRPLADCLAACPVEDRRPAWEGFLAGRPDAEALIAALAAIEPTDPPPAAGPDADRPYATLADVGRVVTSDAWLWPGWLADGVLNVLASEPGKGKTRFAMDLARRLYHGLPWLDGQPNGRAAGARTLWVPGDRNFQELLQVARDFGLPDDAVALGAAPDDPTGGLDLDDPANRDALSDRVAAAAPALVIIDTLGMTTGLNLCKPEDARAYFAPILELAARRGVALLGLTHLSANKEALGRRVVEKARVLLKLEEPDPDGQPNRRRLWVDKSAVVKPPPLGITLGGAGNDYDTNPPEEPAATPGRRGPAPSRKSECHRWLAECLSPNPVRLTDLRRDAEAAGFATSTLYAAREALGVEELKVDGRKWWSLPTADQDGDDPPSA